jgi:hypothetical protein
VPGSARQTRIGSAGMLEQHLGIEAARILPGYAGSPLQVIA